MSASNMFSWRNKENITTFQLKKKNASSKAMLLASNKLGPKYNVDTR